VTLAVAAAASAALAGEPEVAPGALPAPGTSAAVRWVESLGEALDRARAEDRLCLLYLHRPPAT
jgi:hypothetical protein